MKTFEITVFIFTACSLHLVFSTDPHNSVINGQVVSIPDTEINSSNDTINGNASISTPKTSTVSTLTPSELSENQTTPITVNPDTSTPLSSTSTTPPTTSTSAPNSTTSTTTPKPTTTPTPKSTTTQQPTTTTIKPSSSTVKPTSAPPTTPTPSHRRFDGPSFIGGIVLALGLVAIGFVAFKFYKARTELNYHTL